MTTPDAELQLVERAARGDRAAFQLLLVSQRPRIVGYLEKHMPAESRRLVEPSDLFQDVCFEAFRRIDAFEPDGKDDAVFRWLATIARHQLVQFLRSHKTLKRGGNRRVLGAADWRAAMDGDDDSLALLLGDMAISHRTPSQSAMAREVLMALEEAVGQLTPQYRQALELRYMEQLSPSEAANRMNRTEHAFHMLCNRAIKSLRGLMRTASHYV